MDEAFGWALFYQGLPAVTARVETRFHKPIPVGSRVTVKAWVVKQRRRLFDAHAEVRLEGSEARPPAEADAVNVSDRSQEWGGCEQWRRAVNGDRRYRFANSR